MIETRLSAATRPQGTTFALLHGTVVPKGFELDFVKLPTIVEGFRRMVRGQEFDVCEMAFTTYLCAREHGVPFTALPVFLVRALHHGAILRNVRSGVEKPADLEGRQVGVNRGYTVTTGVWARGILEDEHGVDLGAVDWLRSGDEHVAEYAPPQNVGDLPPGKSLTEMLSAAELPAAVNVSVDHPDVTTLIPNPKAAAINALRLRGFYPINHLIVVRNDVLDAHPGLAVLLFEAFARAKKIYVERLRAGIQEPTPADLVYRDVMDFNDDPLPYGLEPNRSMIETLIRYATSQKILRSLVEPEQLFAEDTRGLVA